MHNSCGFWPIWSKSLSCLRMASCSAPFHPTATRPSHPAGSTPAAVPRAALRRTRAVRVTATYQPNGPVGNAVNGAPSAPLTPTTPNVFGNIER